MRVPDRLLRCLSLLPTSGAILLALTVTQAESAFARDLHHGSLRGGGSADIGS